MTSIHHHTYFVTADFVRRLSGITEEACGWTIGTDRPDGYTVYTLHDPSGEPDGDCFEEITEVMHYLTENHTVASAIAEQAPTIWNVARCVDAMERQISEARDRFNLTDDDNDAYALALV